MLSYSQIIEFLNILLIIIFVIGCKVTTNLLIMTSNLYLLFCILYHIKRLGLNKTKKVCAAEDI